VGQKKVLPNSPLLGKTEGAIIIMKKNYISPLMVEVNVEAQQMLAASISKGEGTVETSAAWSNEQRGEWGNLWK